MNPMSVPTTSKVSDPEAFRAAMTPIVAVLRDVTSAITEMPGRFRHQPAAASRGMAELAAEQDRFGKWSTWDRPLTDTHSFGGITLLASCDYVRAFASLFDQERATAYAHLVLARAAMEACVVAEWLNAPAIEPVVRIQRGLAERLYSAREQQRIAPIAERGRKVEQEMLAVADKFGWSVSKGTRVTVGGVGRPSMPTRISELVVLDADRQIGRVQWSYLSSIVHVTWYGLRQSVDPPIAGGGLGPSVAGIGTDTSQVHPQVICLLRLLRAAARARHTLMGWSSDEWSAAESAALDMEAAILDSIRQRVGAAVDDTSLAAAILPEPGVPK